MVFGVGGDQRVHPIQLLLDLIFFLFFFFKGGVLYFIFKIYLFIYLFLAALVFVAARRLSLVVASGGYSSLWCVGFSLRWLLLLQSMGSRCAGFSSCGMRAQ